MSKQSQDKLKEEHRELGKQLNKLHEERKEYEPTETTGSKQTQEGSREATSRIDKEMDKVRDKQKKIYKEHQSNRNG